MEPIGKKIRTLRKYKHLTQEQLAEVLSVSPQTVSKWETGISAPDIGLLPVLARYFGITMDELFNYRLDALNYKERFIRFMADNGILQFGQFRLQSGRISPYYIDTRNYKSGSQITKLGQFYAECLREHNVETSMLFGNTDRELPLMIATGMILYGKYGMDLRYGIREEAIYNTDRITVLKDTLTSGDTLRQTLSRLGPLAFEPPCVIVSVDRMERGAHSRLTARQELERAFGVRIHAIVTIEDIILAMKHGVITNDCCDEMTRYRETYVI